MDLRRYLIHYGQLAQATYDAFNFERASKYAGGCYFTKQSIFREVGLEQGNPFKYNPTKFIYATTETPLPESFVLTSHSTEPWAKDTNWMGYVAVATDEGKALLGRRDIAIAWRGTVEESEWINDFNFPLTSASPLFGPNTHGAQLHSGFLSIYTSKNPDSPYTDTSAREQVLAEVKRLLEKYKDEETSITITGHSLGAALATMSAADIAVNGFNQLKEKPDKSCLVTAFGYGSPRVGDKNFKELLNSNQALHILLTRNALDVVPYAPVTGYTTVGEELLINTLKSDYLKHPGDESAWHSLEVYLHGVAGTQGIHGDFNLVIKRDIALVNKYLDAARDEYLKPVKWWCLRNKGMVQTKQGSWLLEDHELGC